MQYWTGATIGTLIMEDLKLEKRILEEQGEVITQIQRKGEKPTPLGVGWIAQI